MRGPVRQRNIRLFEDSCSAGLKLTGDIFNNQLEGLDPSPIDKYIVSAAGICSGNDSNFVIPLDRSKTQPFTNMKSTGTFQTLLPTAIIR